MGIFERRKKQSDGGTIAPGKKSLLADEKRLAKIVRSNAPEEEKLAATRQIADPVLLKKLYDYAAQVHWNAGPSRALALAVVRQMDERNAALLNVLSEKFLALTERDYAHDETEEEFRQRKMIAYTAMERIPGKEKLALRLALRYPNRGWETDGELMAELCAGAQDNEARQLYLDWLLSEASIDSLSAAWHSCPELQNNRALISRICVEAKYLFQCKGVLMHIRDQALLPYIALNATTPDVGQAAFEMITDPEIKNGFLREARLACKNGRCLWERVSVQYDDSYATTDQTAKVTEQVVYRCIICGKKKTDANRVS